MISKMRFCARLEMCLYGCVRERESEHQDSATRFWSGIHAVRIREKQSKVESSRFDASNHIQQYESERDGEKEMWME